MNVYTGGNIFETYSGNETLSAEQQAMMDRIGACVEVEKFKQLEHYLKRTQGIEQMLIERVKDTWGFDQKGRWFNKGSQYFNPITWRQDTITELLGLSMDHDEYKKHERIINTK